MPRICWDFLYFSLGWRARSRVSKASCTVPSTLGFDAHANRHQQRKELKASAARDSHAASITRKVSDNARSMDEDKRRSRKTTFSLSICAEATSDEFEDYRTDPFSKK